MRTPLGLRYGLWILWILLWGWAQMVGWMQVRAQEIDTPSYRAVTENDSINYWIDLRGSLNVIIQGPEFVQSNKGYPVKTGFRTVYLHVVKCQQASINGGKIPNKGKDMYFVICTDKRKIPSDPGEIKSKASFVKGLIDNSDSMAVYIRLFKEFKTIGDSLKALKEADPENFSREMNEKLGKARMIQKVMLEVVYMYQSLSRAKKRKDLLLFFLTHHMHRSLQYSVVSFPLGLPKYFLEEQEIRPEDYKLRKPRRRIKLNPPPSPEKKRKFRDIELYPS